MATKEEAVNSITDAISVLETQADTIRDALITIEGAMQDLTSATREVESIEEAEE